MKKVLLSLSMLAAVMVANAQNQIVLWNASTSTTQVTGAPFNFGAPDTGTPGTPVPTNPAADEGLRVDTASGNIHAFGSRTKQDPVTFKGGYYVGGFGVGSYQTANVGKPWGTNVTGSGVAMNAYYLNLEIKASGTTAPIIKIQLSSKDSTNVQGYKLDLTSAVGVATSGGYKIYSIALGSFSNTIGQYGDPINSGNNFMTKKYADSLYKVEYSVNVGTTTDGSGSVAFDVKNQWISTSKTGIVTSTASAAANIASTVVFPNPSTDGFFNARVELKNSSSVTIIVSDLTGKQVATKAVVAGQDTRFETTGLTKGMYTVTYVVDGTPAKTELVVVK